MDIKFLQGLKKKSKSSSQHIKAKIIPLNINPKQRNNITD